MIYISFLELLLFYCYLCCRSEDKLITLWRIGQIYGIRLDIQNDFHRLPDLLALGVHRQGVVLDINCIGAALVLDKASASRAFNYRYSWLLLHNATNKSIIEELLSEAVVLPDADVAWSSPIELVDLYRIKPGLPFIMTSLGLNRKGTRQDLDILWSQLPTAVSRRKDLNNVYLKAATIITQPQNFIGWSDLTMRHIDTYPKFTYPLMMLCAEDLHFRYNLIQVDKYGVEQNGSFNGLAGQLQRQEIEVGVTSMFMRSDRLPILHYCSETIGLRGSFIFRQPSQSAVSNMFLLPFSRDVWLAVLLVTLLAAILLALLSKKMQAADCNLQHLTVLETFTFALGTICFHIAPELLSARVVMFFTLITSLFIFTSYSAKIVVILQTPSNAIQTIDDLTQSPMTLGVQETTYKRVYFAESNDPATQRLYRHKLLPFGDRAYLSVVDGVAKLRTGLFAFQVEEPSGYDVISKTFTEREKCDLKGIQVYKLPMVAIPIRKYSGYRELFAARLRWQREVGLMGRERRRWIAEPVQCGAASGGFVSVGLLDAAPAVRALAAGALAAALLLLAELLWARAHRARLRQVARSTLNTQ